MSYSDDEVQDANIVAQSHKAEKHEVSSDLIDRVKNITSGGYAKLGMEKNKYTVRGGVLGGLVFAGMAMYYKKNIWGMAIIGITIGSISGYALGNYIINSKKIKEDATNKKH